MIGFTDKYFKRYVIHTISSRYNHRGNINNGHVKYNGTKILLSVHRDTSSMFVQSKQNQKAHV